MHMHIAMLIAKGLTNFYKDMNFPAGHLSFSSKLKGQLYMSITLYAYDSNISSSQH